VLFENLLLLSQNAQPDLFIGAVRIKIGGHHPDRKYPEIAQGGGLIKRGYGKSQP